MQPTDTVEPLDPVTARRGPRVFGLLALGAVAVGLVVAVVVPSSVFDPSGLDGSVLAEFAAPEPIRVDATAGTDVQYARVALAPDSWMGWHAHDGDELVAVASGRAVSWQVDGGGCTSTTYEAGDGIVEHPHRAHNLYNPGPEPLVLYVTSVTPAHEHVSEDEPRPAGCPAGGDA